MQPRSKTNFNHLLAENPAWNDHVVWNEFRAGSELAFTAIYKRYIYELYHYGERLTANKSLIEDSIHDLFVELWNQRTHYGEVANVKAYLFKGFKNRLIKNLNKARLLPASWHPGTDHDMEIVLSKEAELILGQISEEQKQSIQRGINSLTRREKEAITLRFYDDLSYQEIAEVMSVSLKSTYKLIYRAVGTLKNYLDRIHHL